MSNETNLTCLTPDFKRDTRLGRRDTLNGNPVETSLNSDLLDLVERDLVVGAVVELGGAGTLVGGHGLRVLEGAAIVEIGGDAGGAEV